MKTGRRLVTVPDSLTYGPTGGLVKKDFPEFEKRPVLAQSRATAQLYGRQALRGIACPFGKLRLSSSIAHSRWLHNAVRIHGLRVFPGLLCHLPACHLRV